MRPGVDILPRRGRRRGPIWIAVWVVLLVAVPAGWLVAPLVASSQSPKPAGIEKTAGVTWHPEYGQPLFIMIMGSDQPSGPPDSPGGCDADHVVVVNVKRKTATIVNFPRDSFLTGRKLTDICRANGFQAGVDVLKAETHFPIQYLAHTEFTHMIKLVDEHGGLTINVLNRMYNPGDTGTHFEPGVQHMFGGDVLSFTRDRYNTQASGGADFGRTTNQASVMVSALKRFKETANSMNDLFDYVRTARRNVAFNIPLPDLLRMALIAKDIDPAAVKSITIPGTTGTVDGRSVVFLHPGDIYNQVLQEASAG